ncbi:MAG: small ribosomal subunit Rsm22 family protein [Desulfovibrio sp.]|uniref:small ribosomal subunit Rsm22 family protein n=1 Tax=Desulfovibrio sp. TaxID=885 RepID=UPI0039E40C27
MHGDTARAPRPAAVYNNAWRGAAPLFPPLTEEVRHILGQLPEVLARVWPLSAAHRRSLPDDVARLSRLLTTERAALDRPYWGTPAFVSAYLYYFLPWNLVRLTRLLSAMPLPDPHLAVAQGGKALLLDVGSGPLTLPLALWLARPQWRQAPIQVLALDNSSQPLELGHTLLKEMATLTYHQPWAVQTVRAPLEHAARQAAPLLAGGQVRPWLVSAANVLNELRFGKRGGRASSLDGYEDEMDAAGQMGVVDTYNADDRTSVPGQPMDPEERPDDCRQEKLVRFMDTLAPLFRTHGSARGRSEGQPAGPALLFVEPGTRLGGSTIMDLRQLAVEGGLTALAPCPHQADCPLLGRQGGRTWCHFTFGSEDAPRWLEDLSAEAGLAKSGLSLAPLLLSPVAAPDALSGVEGQGRKTSGAMQARVLTAPFAVPGLAGRGRYACAACGLLLLEDAEGLPSGSLLEVQVTPDARRDGKSGARIVRRPGGSAPVAAPSSGFPASRQQQPFPARNSRRPQWRDGKAGKKS